MQDLVNSQVSLNFLRGIATWCYFDEFHVLLRDPLTASYCVSIWKMLRKKGCVPSALTQNVKDFLASPEIENIFENSDFLVLLSQAQGDRQIVVCGHKSIACHLAAPPEIAQKNRGSYLRTSVSLAFLSPSAVASMTTSSFSFMESKSTSMCFRQLSPPRLPSV